MRATYMTRILTVAFVLVLFGVFSQSANAQFLGIAAWDRKTTVSINKSWEVPGATLPAGTYVFRMLNAGPGGSATRNVVLVFRQDEKKVVAIAMGLTAYRTNIDQPILHFYEVAGGAPERLHTWFYTSFSSGIEFVYPEKAASAN